MTQYTIHEPSEPPEGLIARADATQFIKEGIAWWALLLPMIWLLYHRMWLALLGFLAAAVALEVALYYGGASNSLATLASILFSIVFAMHANDLRRWTLARRGFALVGAVSGSGQGECELKYFASWPDSGAGLAPSPATAPARPVFPRRTEDRDAVIGLFPDGR